MRTAKTIPYGRQSVDDDDVEAVVAALRGEYLTTGPSVERFEKGLATVTGAKHVSVLNSGTAALHAAYFAAGLGPGKKLITSPLTFAATANAALYLGAEVVFADIDPATGCLDPKSVAALLDERVRVVTAVDYAGHPCDYAALRVLQSRFDFTLIADACHSLGATQAGRPVGTLADASCFSFHPVKPITTGEGGAVATDDGDFAARVARFRTHGIERNPVEQAERGGWFYAMRDLGFNYRLCDLQCALGASQLRKLSRFTSRRREIADAYHAGLTGLGLTLPSVRPGAESAWHLYVVRVAEAALRRVFYEQLHAAGLGVQVHYIPVYWHPYYEQLGYRRGLCPEAEEFYGRAVSLPIFPEMGDADVANVIERVRRVRIGQQPTRSAA